MYACRNSKPQGLEENMRLESSEIGRNAGEQVSARRSGQGGLARRSDFGDVVFEDVVLDNNRWYP